MGKSHQHKKPQSVLRRYRFHIFVTTGVLAFLAGYLAHYELAKIIAEFSLAPAMDAFLENSLEK